MCGKPLFLLDNHAIIKIKEKNMQKSFKVTGIDCANCAAKLEKNINKLSDVNSAIVSFATSKLFVDADDDKFEAVMDEIVALANKLEPEWKIER